MRRLIDDRRGAMMVISAFMATFLTGLIWYMIGLSDAMIYHQRMQDTVDSTVFAAAVYHARGMNMIACLNMMMTALLTVVLALGFLAQLLQIVGQTNAGIKPTTDKATDDLNKALTVVGGTQLEDALNGLSEAQKFIGLGMPWLGEERAQNYVPTQSSFVEGGVVMSMSLLPQLLPTQPAGIDSHSDPPYRYGLPVTSSALAELCIKAGPLIIGDPNQPQGELQDAVITLNIDKAPVRPALDAALAIYSKSVESWALTICDPTSPPPFSAADAAAYATQACSQIAADVDRYDACSAAQGSNCTPAATSPISGWSQGQISGFAFKSCVQHQVALASGQAQALPGQVTPGLNVVQLFQNQDPTKQIVPDATLGVAGKDFYFQIYGFVWGAEKHTNAVAPGVAIAARGPAGSRVAGPPASWGAVSLAQAEFYFEPVSASDFESNRLNALWDLRWRARLHHVTLPLSDSGDANTLFTNIASHFSSMHVGGAAATWPPAAIQNYSTPDAAGATGQGAGGDPVSLLIGAVRAPIDPNVTSSLPSSFAPLSGFPIDFYTNNEMSITH